LQQDPAFDGAEPVAAATAAPWANWRNRTTPSLEMGRHDPLESNGAGLGDRGESAGVTRALRMEWA